MPALPEVHHAHAPLHDSLTARRKQALAQVGEHGGSNGGLQQQQGGQARNTAAMYLVDLVDLLHTASSA